MSIWCRKLYFLNFFRNNPAGIIKQSGGNTGNKPIFLFDFLLTRELMIKIADPPFLESFLWNVQHGHQESYFHLPHPIKGTFPPGSHSCSTIPTHLAGTQDANLEQLRLGWTQRGGGAMVLYCTANGVPGTAWACDSSSSPSTSICCFSAGVSGFRKSIHEIDVCGHVWVGVCK